MMKKVFGGSVFRVQGGSSSPGVALLGSGLNPCQRELAGKPAAGSPKGETSGSERGNTENRKLKTSSGFTLLELLVVIAIIAILAGLILSTVGGLQKKAARARAEVEIKGLEAALESYKADMGDYPRGTNIPPSTNNAFLRAALAPNGTNSLNHLNKVYFEFSKAMGPSGSTLLATNVAVFDPFGEGYGYQYPGSTNYSGTNSFDLWSRAGSANSNTWIKNW